MAKRAKSKKEVDDTLVDIVEVKESAEDFFEKNKNIIIYVVGALVLIIGGYLAFKNLYQQPRQKEAVEQMYRAQDQFAQDSFALALTNPGAGYSGFLEIIDSYKGTPAANIANYYAGISYLNLGKFEAALDYLKAFKPAGEITPAMKAGAMGDCYAELGNLDKALNLYKKAVSKSDIATIKAYYLMKVGMLNEKQGNKSAALEAYQQIKKNYPNTPQYQNVLKYIARVSE